MVGQWLGRAEHRHHGVALELVDRAAVGGHDLGHRREVPADDRRDVASLEPLGDRRETADVAEQHRHLDLLRLDRGLGVRGEPLGELLRHEARERVARRGLLDDRGVQTA